MFELDAIDLSTACGGGAADRWTHFQTDLQNRIHQEMTQALGGLDTFQRNPGPVPPVRRDPTANGGCFGLPPGAQTAR